MPANAHSKSLQSSQFSYVWVFHVYVLQQLHTNYMFILSFDGYMVLP